VKSRIYVENYFLKMRNQTKQIPVKYMDVSPITLELFQEVFLGIVNLSDQSMQIPVKSKENINLDD
jgi:hypothetical protein